MSELIRDNETLIGASIHGYDIPIYDDGYGKLFISRDSMGINGIVRAQTWEDAYEICEDEFFPNATETHEQMVQEYGDNYTENDIWQENYGFRPNFNGTSGIYQKDLNGDYLDELTPELTTELDITLSIEVEESEDCLV